MSTHDTPHSTSSSTSSGAAPGGPGGTVHRVPSRTAAPLTRRGILVGAAGTVVAGTATATLGTADPAGAASGDPGGGPERIVDTAGLGAIEARHDRRVGVYARNLRTGRTLVHRADERFAMCSTFKVLAAGAVLDQRLLSPDPRILGRSVHWPPSLTRDVGYAVRVEQWQREGHDPSVAEVCEAAVAESDNAAGNLLLQLIGGPHGITALACDLGDRVTALTRWEPDLNDWAPGLDRDTTTPRAIARTYARLLLGPTLARPQRERLTGWMAASVTGTRALRAGLPAGWSIAEKTGSGAYGTRNDVGIARTPDGAPVVIACLTRAEDADAATVEAPLAEVGALCARLLG